MMLSMAGGNVKVKIKANTMPTDIIFPNSMTGLMSPNIKESLQAAYFEQVRGQRPSHEDWLTPVKD